MLYFVDYDKVTWHKFIWHKHYAIRFSSFAWLAVMKGLKTADILSERNIYINPICPLCEKEEESILHLFFQCDFSFEVLITLIPDAGNFLLRPTILQIFEFLDEIQRFNSNERNFSFLMICCLVYFIWRERNSRRFMQKKASPMVVLNLAASAIVLKSRRWKIWENFAASFPSCYIRQTGFQVDQTPATGL
ncbi:hypothetical protein MA16_Dca000551 [Dendrobium catenatum]|uniref:Reverse transcriptase zinc-binding domain-containing protein n=1 Tax=Dendrobium catenatum TaxID=906689 RepID=A0A2I0WU77_9ASPA|nr:hypothetical protein MA16_Dca000551 [Dendrobium catenatum]